MSHDPANSGNEGQPRPDDVSTVRDSQAMLRGEQQDPLIGTNASSNHLLQASKDSLGDGGCTDNDPPGQTFVLGDSVTIEGKRGCAGDTHEGFSGLLLSGTSNTLSCGPR